MFSVPPSEAVSMINRAKQFYLKSLKNYQLDIEEAYGAFDLARSIYEYRGTITEVKIILMTNGTIRSTMLETEEVAQLKEKAFVSCLGNNQGFENFLHINAELLKGIVGLAVYVLLLTTVQPLLVFVLFQ